MVWSADAACDKVSDFVNKLAPCIISQVTLCYYMPDLEVTHWNTQIMHRHKVIICQRTEIFSIFVVRKDSRNVLLGWFLLSMLPWYVQNVLAGAHVYACTLLTLSQGFPWQPWRLLLIHHWNVVMLTKTFKVHLENCTIYLWCFNIHQFLFYRVWHQYLQTIS